MGMPSVPPRWVGVRPVRKGAVARSIRVRPSKSQSKMSTTLILQTPAGSARLLLLLLFHGVGGTARSMELPGLLLAHAFPDALVVSIDAAHVSDLGSGRQWFSVRGVTEENRPARVDSAMPAFRESIAQWQRVSGVGARATVLVGFSQGAIMALESARRPDAPPDCVFAIAGRFARSPGPIPSRVRLHLLHGQMDSVIPVVYTQQAARELLACGADLTVDVLPGAGHELTAEIAGLSLIHI